MEMTPFELWRSIPNDTKMELLTGWMQGMEMLRGAIRASEDPSERPALLEQLGLCEDDLPAWRDSLTAQLQATQAAVSVLATIAEAP